MRLLVFGYGYTSRALVQSLPDGWHVTATTRSPEKAAAMQAAANQAAAMQAEGITPRLFPGDNLTADLAQATHVLISAGPQDGHDPVLADLRNGFAQARQLKWLGYLSTTGVYGDHNGDWVDENTALTPSTERGHARVTAENEWMDLHRNHGLPLHIFRLAGIYGPGRGPFAKLRNGTARRIIKQGQVFSRIHVEDIAQVLLASMSNPAPGTTYNVCDDDPAPPQDVIAYAATLLGLPIPPDLPFEQATLSPMARSFYGESKRADNTRIKSDLGIRLRYPDYRSGLQQLHSAESHR
ncbi:MAG: SDR family oxidoreductase [Roseicyclus sp.]|nr:SDR family oxidoreductase [Roseicyclus sp.]